MSWIEKEKKENKKKIHVTCNQSLISQYLLVLKLRLEYTSFESYINKDSFVYKFDFKTLIFEKGNKSQKWPNLADQKKIKFWRIERNIFPEVSWQRKNYNKKANVLLKLTNFSNEIKREEFLSLILCIFMFLRL